MLNDTEDEVEGVNFLYSKGLHHCLPCTFGQWIIGETRFGILML